MTNFDLQTIFKISFLAIILILLYIVQYRKEKKDRKKKTYHQITKHLN